MDSDSSVEETREQKMEYLRRGIDKNGRDVAWPKGDEDSVY